MQTAEGRKEVSSLRNTNNERSRRSVAYFLTYLPTDVCLRYVWSRTVQSFSNISCTSKAIIAGCAPCVQSYSRAHSSAG